MNLHEQLKNDNQNRIAALQRQGITFQIPNFYTELLLEAAVKKLYPEHSDICDIIRHNHERKVAELLTAIEAEVRKATITQGVTTMKPHGV